MLAILVKIISFIFYITVLVDIVFLSIFYCFIADFRNHSLVSAGFKIYCTEIQNSSKYLGVFLLVQTGFLLGHAYSDFKVYYL